jgi:hypothetical protein
MPRIRRRVTLMGLLVWSCAEQPSTGVSAADSQVAFAISRVDTHSRARLLWKDSVLVNGLTIGAGVTGDGRNRAGQTSETLNEYQGNYCGVDATIWDQKGESGTLDPDTDLRYDAATMATACGAARQMALYLGTATSTGTSATWVGPHFFFDAIWNLAPGESRVQPMTFGTQQVVCQLKFDSNYAGASPIRLTRLPDVQATNGSGQIVTAREWRAESQGSHAAACLRLQPNGKYVDTGIRYFLPFSVTVTQVPYPYAVYP